MVFSEFDVSCRIRPWLKNRQYLPERNVLTLIEKKMEPMLRKLILHAGTPKSGTTSLQRYLNTHRAALLHEGILYPRAEMAPDQKPKHQWIVDTLLAGNGGQFRGEMQAVLTEVKPDTHTIILSTEGLFNHWWDFAAAGRHALASLVDKFSVSVWVWFRDPVSFVRSSYIQMLKNPRGDVFSHGRDLSVDEVLDDPWFSKHLDYIGFVREVDGVLGRGTVVPFAYQGDTIRAFLTSLGVECPENANLHANRTLGEVGVDLLRIFNRHELPEKTKRAGVTLIGEVDTLLGPSSQPLQLGSKAEDRIRALASESMDSLERDFGLLLCSPTQTRQNRLT